MKSKVVKLMFLYLLAIVMWFITMVSDSWIIQIPVHPLNWFGLFIGLASMVISIGILTNNEIKNHLWLIWVTFFFGFVMSLLSGLDFLNNLNLINASGILTVSVIGILCTAGHFECSCYNHPYRFTVISNMTWVYVTGIVLGTDFSVILKNAL